MARNYCKTSAHPALVGVGRGVRILHRARTCVAQGERAAGVINLLAGGDGEKGEAV